MPPFRNGFTGWRMACALCLLFGLLGGCPSPSPRYPNASTEDSPSPQAPSSTEDSLAPPSTEDTSPVSAGPGNTSTETAEQVEASTPPCALTLPLPEAPNRHEALALGASHSCFLDGTGQAYCWGSARFSQIGDGEAPSYRGHRTRPVTVRGGPYVRLRSGYHHVCGLTAEGAVDCWGHGGFGQQRNEASENGSSENDVPESEDASTDHVTPTRLLEATDGDAQVVDLSAGDGFTCVLQRSGSVRCIGRNDMGQLGSAPDDRAGWQTVPQVCAYHLGSGRAHSCAVAAEGAVCWGENLDGQLGRGHLSAWEPPGRVSLPQSPPADARFALGGGHTCLAGSVEAPEMWCWGRNDSHQLGIDLDDAASITPTSANDAAPAGEALSAIPTPTRIATPQVQATSNGPAIQIAAGSRFTCRAPAPSCVGLGHRGQIGDGGERMRTSWSAVRSLPEPVDDIATGAAHGCALTARGVYCWGNNNRGQLGDGTRTRRPRPRRVRHLDFDVE